MPEIFLKMQINTTTTTTVTSSKNATAPRVLEIMTASCSELMLGVGS